MRPYAAFITAGVCAGAALAILGAFTYAHNAAQPDPTPCAERSNEAGFTVVDWDYWKSINPDIIGWVNVPNTQIDLPIMAADRSNPDFYLKHDIYRHYNPYGVPYLDADCEGDLEAQNALIYGHHMNDGSMFSDFANFIDRSYLEDHTPIYLQTPDKKVKLSVRFVDVINGAHAEKRTTFEDFEDFHTWYQSELETATLAVDEELMPRHIVTFCTCSYSTYRNERTLVVASESSDDLSAKALKRDESSERTNAPTIEEGRS